MKVFLIRLRSRSVATLRSDPGRLAVFAILFLSVFNTVYRFVDRKAHLDPEAYFESVSYIKQRPIQVRRELVMDETL